MYDRDVARARLVNAAVEPRSIIHEEVRARLQAPFAIGEGKGTSPRQGR